MLIADAAGEVEIEALKAAATTSALELR